MYQTRRKKNVSSREPHPRALWNGLRVFSLVPMRNVLNVVAPPASHSTQGIQMSISGTRRAEICSRASPLSMREKSVLRPTVKKRKRKKMEKRIIKRMSFYLSIDRSRLQHRGLIVVRSDDRK